MFKLLAKIRKNQEGATAIEYALIASVLAVGIIAGLAPLKNALNSKFNSIAVNVTSGT